MRYLPQTESDIASMCETIGISNADELFANIPSSCRREGEMVLPLPLSEWELNRHMDALAADVVATPEYQNYTGAGSYDHYIPYVSPYLLSRSEFCTAYTPYQPELSQGTLQAVFEYQTYVTRLLGMDVANASVYDGAMALAEAMLMSIRVTRKTKVALSAAIHPSYRRVVKTYLDPTGVEIIEIPFTKEGTTDVSKVSDITDLASIAVQSPNFFGCIENLGKFGDIIHAQNGLLIGCFSESLAFGLIKNPGSYGCDIACGEGQSLGIPKNYGGPALGMFACTNKIIRNMPGRLVGMTTDSNGKRGFVLTLATREQHIRREKATSNICTNNSLNALSALVYMSSLGSTGMKMLAKQNYNKTEYLKNKLKKSGIEIPFSAPTFNEFVVKFPYDFSSKYNELLQNKRIIAGIPIDRYYKGLENAYLLCVTETKTKADLDHLAEEVAK